MTATFIHKISDPKIGSTNITLLASVQNLGFIYPGVFVYLVDVVNFNALFALSCTYSVLYFFSQRADFMKLSTYAEEDWRIKDY